MAATQKSLPLLHRFQRAVGGGNIYYKRGTDVHQCVIDGLANVQYALGLMWPYLGDEKRAQAIAAVEKWAVFPRAKFKTSRLTLERG